MTREIDAATIRRVLLVAAAQGEQMSVYKREKARTGITISECVASVTEAQFPRHERRKQNQWKVKSSRRSLRNGEVEQRESVSFLIFPMILIYPV